MAKKLVEYMTKQGIKFVKGNASKFDKQNDKILVSLEKDEDGKIINEQEEYDNVFQAIGRQPETKKINLE